MKSKEEKAADQAQQEAEFKKKFNRLRADFIKVAETPEGLAVFTFMMGECGYQQNNIVFNPVTKEINKDASDYLEARRSVYLQLRKYIPVKYLRKIENK